MSYFINKIFAILLLLLIYNKCDANQRVSAKNKCYHRCFGDQSCIKHCEHRLKTSFLVKQRSRNFKHSHSVMSFSGNTFSSPSQCGLRSRNTKSYSYTERVKQRIIGGEDSSPHEFPWIVSFQGMHHKSYGVYVLKHFCGGTIINEKYVLTAAHCLDKYHEFIDRIIIKAGINYLTEKGQTLHPEKFIVHEKWNDKYIINDIALVKVKERIQFNTNNRNQYLVNSVCLNQHFETPNGYAKLAGWGKLDFKSTESSYWLQKLSVPIWERNKCAKNYADYIEPIENCLTKLLVSDEFRQIEKTQICAGGKGGEDVWVGDSGGPLTQQRNSRSYQIGIASFGIPCALKDLPGVYTDVYQYIGWIKSHAK